MIPVVSRHDLSSADPDVQARVAEAIRLGLGTYGLIYIRDHGVDRAQVLDTYDAFLDVLDRPDDEKASWGGESLWYQRGWTPPDTERAVVAGGQPDFKECYFAAPMPLDARCRRAWPQVYADNVWPRDAGRFRDGMMGLGQQIHAIGLELLGGCERALELAPGTLTDLCTGAAHVTRLLKYLPLDQRQIDAGTLWGEEHTDFNLLTLLPGGSFYRGRTPDAPADGGGLYLRTRASAEHPRGEMVRGKPPEGCIVAQVGQQLEVLTAGRLLATPHVITAPKSPGWTRCSLAHFLHLHGRAIVGPLDVYAEDDAAGAYQPPVLAGTYANKTLVDIGLAPRESLDRLGYRHYGRLSSYRAAEDGVL